MLPVVQEHSYNQAFVLIIEQKHSGDAKQNIGWNYNLKNVVHL